MNDKAAIIVMCKAPIAGTVKTRLVPFLSPEQAADLAAWFAVDTILKDSMTTFFNVIIAYAPSDGRNLLKKILPKSNLLWSEQQGFDLGERMHNALLFAAGYNDYSPLIVIGTDSPTLPFEQLEQAADILSKNRADVVLGPTEDGGYYLVGMQHPNSSVFQNVEWSSPRAFEQTAKNVKNLDLRLQVLPVWYDVDTPEDLKRLRQEIQDEILSDENAAQTAPNTTQWLRQNDYLF